MKPLELDPQASSEEGVYLLMQRVHAMCKEYGVEPSLCVKFNSRTPEDVEELFSMLFDPNVVRSVSQLEFAIAVVENRPVFRGDRLWHLNDEVEAYAVCGSLIKTHLCSTGQYRGYEWYELSWTAAHTKSEWHHTTKEELATRGENEIQHHTV